MEYSREPRVASLTSENRAASEAVRKIVITGGGTGGHVFPAIAIASEMRRRGYRPIYVGSPTGMEAKLAPENDVPFVPIESIQVKNKSPLLVAKGLGKLLKAVLRSWRLLRRERPVAVVGVGGYVSVPVCFAAWLSGIPVFLQEQNASVGIANRVLGRIARRVFLGFGAAESSFPRSRCVVTGNPLRREFRETAFPQPDPSRPRLLIFGGSQGATAINSAILSRLPELQKRFPDLPIVHQTGKSDWERVRDEYAKTYGGPHEVLPFLTDMPRRYAEATLVVSRSGALTISELLAARRPAILVPYPRKGQNDQTANAYHLERLGVAMVVEQGDRFEERLWTAIFEMLRPERIHSMLQRFSGLHVPDALVSIGDHLESEARGQATG